MRFVVETVRGQREHARKCDDTVEAFMLATVAAQLVNRYLGSRHAQPRSRGLALPTRSRFAPDVTTKFARFGSV